MGFSVWQRRWVRFMGLIGCTSSSLLRILAVRAFWMFLMAGYWRLDLPANLGADMALAASF